MAPLPPENTARLFIDYEVANVPHSFQVRFDATVRSVFAVANDVYSILNFAASGLSTSFIVTGARVAAANSAISLPYSLEGTDLFGFSGDNTGTLPESEYPRELVWVGRSPTSGRRVRFSLYGYVGNTPGNYRFGPGEVVFSSLPVISALNAASTAGSFIAIDGTAATWYGYVNVNYNSHWESEART